MKINVEQFLETLPIMGMGLAGIFTVTVIIMLTIYILNKFSSK